MYILLYINESCFRVPDKTWSTYKAMKCTLRHLVTKKTTLVSTLCKEYVKDLGGMDLQLAGTCFRASSQPVSS